MRDGPEAGPERVWVHDPSNSYVSYTDSAARKVGVSDQNRSAFSSVLDFRPAEGD